MRCSDGLRSDSLLTSVVLLSVWHYDPLMPDTFLGEVVLLVDNFRSFHQLMNNRRYQSRAEWLPLRRPVEPADGPFAVCSLMFTRCYLHRVSSSKGPATLLHYITLWIFNVA